MTLVGYSDRPSVAPGERIQFMVSCEQPAYDVRLVRLIHGDTNPNGPGFKQRLVPSATDGRKPGKREVIRSGSYVDVALDGVDLSREVTFCAFVQATNPAAGAAQVIAGQGTPLDGTGWALALSAEGDLQVIGGGKVVARLGAMQRWAWYLLALSLRVKEDGTATLGTAWRRPLRAWPDDPPGVVAFEAESILPPPGAALMLAGARDAAGRPAHHFDGRIDRPRLLAGTVTGERLQAWADLPDDLATLAEAGDLAGAWDFSRDIGTALARDVSGNGRHGRVVNLPARGVTGHNFRGDETCFRLAPHQYGAIHFHRDDLEDAGWAEDFALTVPDDLPSGVYAAWLTTPDGRHEEHVPFVVRPPRGRRSSRIAVLMSTVTYQCYSNYTDLGVGAWRDGAAATWSSNAPFADPSLSRDVYRYIDENALYGPYDLHLDGSGVMYSSWLKPNLTMRPKFRYRVMAAPPRFPADLYLVDWLDAKGIEVDYLTDHDLHAGGRDLLDGYRVVISSSHHEYWTGPMLDALGAYLDAGGRFMYLSGNGLYGVASIDPARPHVMEVRRWGTSWPFEVHPADRYHSTTGEPGGTWRNRGRPPNLLVGVGTAGAEFGSGVPFHRMPASRDPRVAFIFEGVGDDEPIGDFANLQVRHGAAGYEFDRVEAELGSPPGTLVLASSVGFDTALAKPMIDERLWFAAGRDGAGTDDPQRPDTPHRFVRADMAYLEYPNGGAVFSAGAICWRGALSWNGYDNNVSRITENVLRAFST